MESACAFAVFQIALAIKAAGVAREGELGILLARLGEVEALEGADGPIRLVMGIPAVLMRDQGELHFARFAGAVQRPIPCA